jgi:hypothetical protein
MKYKCLNDQCGYEGAAQFGAAFLGVTCPACGSAMGIVRQPPLSFGWAETLMVGLGVLLLVNVIRNPKKWLL